MKDKPIQISNMQEYREYMEHVEKYPKRHHKWDVEFEWNLSIKDVRDPEIREEFKGNIDLLDEFEKYYGLVVADSINPIYYGELTNLQVTNEDFYWVVRKDDGHTLYLSCCSGLKIYEGNH